nr:myosin-11-like [Aegilops tauschii subsp. strangulata]
MLINSKVGTGTYLLDKEHIPLRPDFEDNVVVMDASHPTSVEAHEKIEKAKATKAAKAASAPDASIVNLKTKQDQITYLLEATLRIEKSLATLTKNQESLERIVEDKMYNLDVKVREIQTIVEKLRDDAEDNDDRPTTDRFRSVPRAQRSIAEPVADLRPDFEDNEVVMDASHPTSVEAHEKIEKAKATKAAKAASAPDASIVNLKTKQDQLTYLLEATMRIEKSLANLTKNQESLERIVEDKMYNLDVKVREIQTIVEKLRDDAEDNDDRPTTDRFRPDFEDNEVVMDASHPTSVEAHEKIEKAKATKAAKAASAPDASIVNLKTKQDQLTYLLEATLRIEKSLANLTKNQESLERIVEDKMYNLDVKVREIQTIVEKLRDDAEDNDDRPTTDRFRSVPRAQRSIAEPVADLRSAHSAPATTAIVSPPVSTPPTPQTSAKALQMDSSQHRLHTPELQARTPLQELPEIFKVMSLIVETIKRTTANQKRPDFEDNEVVMDASHPTSVEAHEKIEKAKATKAAKMLINSKVGTGTYLLDKEHIPLRPDFEDNEVVMDASHPTSVEAHEKIEKAKATKAAKAASAPDASIVNLKTKQDQLTYLLEATLRIEKSLANLTKNQESLERIVEDKMYNLDVKVREIQTIVEKLRDDAEDNDDRPTTDRFRSVPRAQRSIAEPVADLRSAHSAPATTTTVSPPVSTPPTPQTLAKAFADGLLSTPSTHTRATSQNTPSGAPRDRT